MQFIKLLLLESTNNNKKLSFIMVVRSLVTGLVLGDFGETKTAYKTSTVHVFVLLLAWLLFSLFFRSVIILLGTIMSSKSQSYWPLISYLPNPFGKRN